MNMYLPEEKQKRRARSTARIARTLFLLQLFTGIALVASRIAVAAPEPVENEVPVVDEGRIPGDDTPATTRCYMTDEEVQEDFENEKIEAALLSSASVITDVTVTHYCCERYPHICGTGAGITASGRVVTPYVSCAVDPDVIPLGSDVIVDYGDGKLHYYRADDTGGAIKGSRIDLAVTTHEEALEQGVKTATVYWVAPKEER